MEPLSHLQVQVHRMILVISCEPEIQTIGQPQSVQSNKCLILFKKL